MNFLLISLQKPFDIGNCLKKSKVNLWSLWTLLQKVKWHANHLQLKASSMANFQSVGRFQSLKKILSHMKIMKIRTPWGIFEATET